MNTTNKNPERFEELRIWQESRRLVTDIYRDMRDGSGARDFSFRNQIQSAGISSMNNIAEGFERWTDADFAHFLDIAKGSSGEVRSMYYAAEDLGYIASSVAQSRREHATGISKGIASLISHLRPT